MSFSRPGNPGGDVTRRRFCAGLGAAVGAVAAVPWPLAAAESAARVVAPGYPAMIGALDRYTATKDDTLVDLARRFDVGFTELVAANPGVDIWLPGAGAELVVPTAHILPDAPREGLVLNLADQRLYIFRAETGVVDTVPIGVGRDAWNTPIGRTRVVRKRANPAWYVPKSIRAEDPTLPAVVPAGPNNPLGAFAVYLGWPGYLLHGTNKPMGVGRRVSHGCVRLYPEDIKRHFPSIAIGTAVTVVDQPVKIAWVGGALMLEIHPSQAQADEMEAGNNVPPEKPSDFEYRILDAAGDAAQRLDWALIARLLRQRRGVPVDILKHDNATSSES